MRRVSLVFSSKSLSIERTALGDLLRRRWLIATLRRINFPVPVILTRFAMALCVFSFCFMFLLSCSLADEVWAIVFLNQVLRVYRLERTTKQSRHKRREAVWVAILALQTQYYSHKYSIEGAEKPMSGVHPVAQRL